jgi:hypothetical protein
MGQIDRAGRRAGGHKASGDARQAWRNQPDTPFDLIMRVEGDLSERSRQLTARGVEIRRRHWLTPSLSVRCTGQMALGLLDVDWIVRIELDKPVSAIDGQPSER